MARKQQSFESSLERLGELVALLERDDTPLAEAMKLYSEGIQLAAECRAELNAAELKITELQASAVGQQEAEEGNGDGE